MQAAILTNTQGAGSVGHSYPQNLRRGKCWPKSKASRAMDGAGRAVRDDVFASLRSACTSCAGTVRHANIDPPALPARAPCDMRISTRPHFLRGHRATCEYRPARTSCAGTVRHANIDPPALPARAPCDMRHATCKHQSTRTSRAVTYENH